MFGFINVVVGQLLLSNKMSNDISQVRDINSKINIEEKKIDYWKRELQSSKTHPRSDNEAFARMCLSNISHHKMVIDGYEKIRDDYDNYGQEI